MAHCKLEIACFNSESARIAEQGGADRIELCNNMQEGGTTPSIECIIDVRKNSALDLFVMIRPRGGDFFYTAEEFNEMKKTISLLKDKGVDGFVFGILNANKTIDVIRNKELVELAHPLSCTFHRAFDQVADLMIALEAVIDCGFKTILTSGNYLSAVEGIHDLELLIKQANNRIIIMPGGGVRSGNIKMLKDTLNAMYFHSSAITRNSELADLNEVIALKQILNA